MCPNFHCNLTVLLQVQLNSCKVDLQFSYYKFYRMSNRYWANILSILKPGPVLGNLDLNRSLVWDLYSGTWTHTRKLWIWPVLVYVLRFPSTTFKCGSISMGHTVHRTEPGLQFFHVYCVPGFPIADWCNFPYVGHMEKL